MASGDRCFFSGERSEVYHGDKEQRSRYTQGGIGHGQSRETVPDGVRDYALHEDERAGGGRALLKEWLKMEYDSTEALISCLNMSSIGIKKILMKYLVLPLALMNIHRGIKW